jgi:hypothetical protein
MQPLLVEKNTTRIAHFFPVICTVLMISTSFEKFVNQIKKLGQNEAKEIRRYRS